MVVIANYSVGETNRIGIHWPVGGISTAREVLYSRVGHSNSDLDDLGFALEIIDIIWTNSLNMYVESV
jgi:hypothetical protein